MNRFFIVFCAYVVVFQCTLPCDNLFDSGPVCSGTDIRLVNADTQYDGNVQVCHSGYWGSVCGIGWDDTDASVACRQLEFLPIGRYTTVPTAK